MEPTNTEDAPPSSAPTTAISAPKSSARTRRKLIKYIKYLHQQDQFWDRALASSQDAFIQMAEAEQRNAAVAQQRPQQLQDMAILRPRSQQSMVNNPTSPQDCHLRVLNDGFRSLFVYLDKCESTLDSIIEDAEPRLRARGISVD